MTVVTPIGVEGGEDDNFKRGLLKHNLTIQSYPKDMTTAKCCYIKKSPKNPNRNETMSKYDMLQKNEKMMHHDLSEFLKVQINLKDKTFSFHEYKRRLTLNMFNTFKVINKFH